MQIVSKTGRRYIFPRNRIVTENVISLRNALFDRFQALERDFISVRKESLHLWVTEGRKYSTTTTAAATAIRGRFSVLRK